MAVLVDQVIKIGIFPGFAIINHTPEHILGMGAKIGTISVITCYQIPGKMGNRHNAAVFRLICRRRMGILFRWNPWRPGTAVHKCIPGIVACMVCLWPFFPAGGHSTFNRRICLLNIMNQLCVHIVRTCGFRIKTKPVIKLFKYIIDDSLFIFHGKHPDTKIFRLIFLTKLLTWKTQQRQADFIPVCFVMLLCYRNRFIIEQAGICHLNGCL